MGKVAIVAVAVVFAAGCSSGSGGALAPQDGDGPRAPATSTSTTAQPSAPLDVVPIALGTEALQPLAAYDAAWVPGRDPNQPEGSGDVVWRVDAASREVATIPVPGGGTDLAASDGAVWVIGPEAVSRIDPASQEVTDRIPVAEGLVRIAAGDGGIWLAGDGSGSIALARIDPGSRTLGKAVDVPTGRRRLRALAVGEGAVWVLSGEEGKDRAVLARIDPETGEVEAETQIPRSAGTTVVPAKRGAWVTVRGEDRSTGGSIVQLARVDGSSAKLAEPVELPVSADLVAGSVAGFWAIGRDGEGTSFAVELDPKTGAERSRARIGGSSAEAGTGLAVGTGYLWLRSLEGSGSVFRVGPT